MPVDPSIILGVQTPQFQSPLDAASKALAMKSLAMRSQLEGVQTQQAMQQFNDDQDLRQAYRNNVTVNPDSSTSFDQQGFLKDIAATNPSLFPKAQQQLATQNLSVIENHKKMNDMAIQYLNGVHDQPSLDTALASAKANGLPINNISPVYDPNNIKMALAQTLNTKDYLQQELESRKNDIAEREADIKAKELGMKVTQNKAEQNQQTLGALQALRGNPALQRAETNVLAAKNMSDLAEQVRDPKTGKINLNNMTPQQVSLIDHEAIRMATGGTGNEQDMENLKPGTPQYKWAELHQKLTGKQTGAQAAPYIQQMLDYSSSLSKSANEFLYQNAKHVVDAKRNYLAPEDQQKYDTWLGDLKTGKAFFGDVAGNPVSQGSGSNQGVHPDLQGKSLADLIQMKNDMLKKQQANK